MATVYSLVCWGGRLGKSVTLTIASPCVVTSTNHGLRDGTGLVFSTTGALPTGITAGTTYYVRSTAVGTFNLYDTEAHAKDTANTAGRVNTSGTQSGTQTAQSKKMLDYLAQYPTRWWDEVLQVQRCYDGIASYQAARVSQASSTNSEVCEIGEAFDEYATAKVTINVPAYETIITPEVNGVRTSAWHGGVYGSGYRFMSKTELYDWGLVFSGMYQSLSGVSVVLTGNNCQGLNAAAMLSTFRDLMIYRVAGSGQDGLNVTGVACVVDNCLVANITIGNGIGFSQYTGSACTVSNCIVTKCTGTGMSAPTDVVKHSVFNVMSVGNTTNWSAKPTGLTAAGNNFGISADAPWYVGTDTSIKTLTADNATFVDYANNNFRPASATAPQVDTATTLLRGYNTDISGSERPNYNNGGAEAWDGGCYEFDHGFGNHPASTTVTFSGVNAGSEIRVYDASGNELAGVESSAANPELTWVLSTGDVRIVVVHLSYKIKDFQYTPVSGAVSLPVQQEADSWYSNPA